MAKENVDQLGVIPPPPDEEALVCFEMGLLLDGEGISPRDDRGEREGWLPWLMRESPSMHRNLSMTPGGPEQQSNPSMSCVSILMSIDPDWEMVVAIEGRANLRVRRSM